MTMHVMHVHIQLFIDTNSYISIVCWTRKLQVLKHVPFWNVAKQVLDKPKITDTDHGVQNMEGNVGSCASGSVEEETVKNDQAECVPAEVIVEECTGEAIESKEEVSL